MKPPYPISPPPPPPNFRKENGFVLTPLPLIRLVDVTWTDPVWFIHVLEIQICF